MSVMLEEAKEIPILSRFKPISMISNGPVAGRINSLFSNPRRIKNEQQLVSGYYKEGTPLGHLIQ
jgi:hypothetical protein